MTACIKPSGKGMDADLKQMMTFMLETSIVDALVLPVIQPDKVSVLPALITSPDQVDKARLLSPCFSINAARMVSRLSFKPAGRKTAVWLRPCEIRAFTELEKLNQASRDELIIMGMDCPMSLDRKDYQDYMAAHSDEVDHWAAQVYPDPAGSGLNMARSCTMCTHPVAQNADLNFCFYGSTPDQGIVVDGTTSKGSQIMSQLSLDAGAIPEARATAASDLVAAGQAVFEKTAQEVGEATNSLDKLEQYFGACINCYNCRNVCPVCYCRECVFNTDVFAHEPVQYHQWADKWGQIRLPSDTLFYHLTRLAHMSHACVGCGQCTRACPSDIPVADLFITVARDTQAAFDYLPGSEDPPPFTEFKADEYQDVVGIE